MAMTYNARIWLHGAVAAAINGFASAFVLVVADPQKFNLFEGGATRLLIVSGLAGVMGLMTFLKDHPLPDPAKDIDAESAAVKQIAHLTTTLNGTGDGSFKE